jgi:type IV secretory pathway protease TraF
MVVARLPEPIRSLAAERRYLPANVPLVKRVAAASGDRLCARGSEIRINGRLVATRLGRDRLGRPMPWWSGCRRLEAGEIFLLMDRPLSFDGRYFGIIGKSDVVGRAGLLRAS